MMDGAQAIIGDGIASSEVPLVVDVDRALAIDGRIAGMVGDAASAGRTLLFLTAGDPAAAKSVVDRLDLGTDVAIEQIGPGAGRAAFLRSRFAEGFDYAGGMGADIETIAVARQSLAARITVETRPSQIRELARSMRLHQWIKNLLVFVPLALSGEVGDIGRLTAVAVAFVALGLSTGATYLFNDLCDVRHDRLHWSKRHRPLASGRLSKPTAQLAIPLVLVAGFAIGASVSWSVAAFLGLYVAGTLAYSLVLKRVPIVDVVGLAALFTVRLAIGIQAAEVATSAWLLVFSMFLFASLGCAKRYAEMLRASTQRWQDLPGRGYRVTDAPLMLAIGTACALGATGIMVMYIIEDVLTLGAYHNKIGLWGLPLLIYLLLARIWLTAHRGALDDDPVEFVTSDKASLLLLALTLLCYAVSWLGPRWP